MICKVIHCCDDTDRINACQRLVITWSNDEVLAAFLVLKAIFLTNNGVRDLVPTDYWSVTERI